MVTQRSLAGVLVWTTHERFEAMRRFYVETVGLTPRWIQVHRFDCCAFRARSTQLTSAWGRFRHSE